MAVCKGHHWGHALSTGVIYMIASLRKIELTRYRPGSATAVCKGHTICHCTLAAALYFEQSSCDELMEFKQIQTRAQPEESLKHNHSCTNLSPE